MRIPGFRAETSLNRVSTEFAGEFTADRSGKASIVPQYCYCECRQYPPKLYWLDGLEVAIGGHEFCIPHGNCPPGHCEAFRGLRSNRLLGVRA